MFAFTLLVQKRVSKAQKRVDNARLFDSDEVRCSFQPMAGYSLMHEKQLICVCTNVVCVCVCVSSSLSVCVCTCVNVCVCVLCMPSCMCFSLSLVRLYVLFFSLCMCCSSQMSFLDASEKSGLLIAA